MNNTTDTFRAIAADAVELLLAVVKDLAAHDDLQDQLASLIIGNEAAELCARAIALDDERA